MKFCWYHKSTSRVTTIKLITGRHVLVVPICRWSSWSCTRSRSELSPAWLRHLWVASRAVFAVSGSARTAVRSVTARHWFETRRLELLPAAPGTSSVVSRFQSTRSVRYNAARVLLVHQYQVQKKRIEIQPGRFYVGTGGSCSQNHVVPTASEAGKFFKRFKTPLTPLLCQISVICHLVFSQFSFLLFCRCKLKLTHYRA